MVVTLHVSTHASISGRVIFCFVLRYVREFCIFTRRDKLNFLAECRAGRTKHAFEGVELQPRPGCLSKKGVELQPRPGCLSKIVPFIGV